MSKLILILIFQLLISYIDQAQEVLIETTKKEYKLNEKIEVTFKIEFEEDSVKFPKFNNFKIINTPSTTTSSTFINEQKSYDKTWTFILRANKSGQLNIKSPIFYNKGKKIIGKKIKLKILKSKLTALEQKEIKFKFFVEDNLKPNGTYRYIINKEFGYIEIFKNLEWQFYRKLTEKESKLIRQVN